MGEVVELIYYFFFSAAWFPAVVAPAIFSSLDIETTSSPEAVIS